MNTTHYLVEKPIESCCDDCGYVMCIYIGIELVLYTKVKEVEKLVDAH